MKTLKLIIATVVTALSLASCNNEYKPFDTGIAIIKAEYSLDSLNREIQARHIERQRLELNKFAEYYNSLTPAQQDSIKTLRRTLKGL